VDPNTVILREEEGHHDRVLLADLACQFSKHTGRHAEVDPDVEDMPHPDTTTGGDQDLVVPGEFSDLFDQRVDNLPPVIDDTVAADLDHVQVRHDPDLPDSGGLSHQAPPDQALVL